MVGKMVPGYVIPPLHPRQTQSGWILPGGSVSCISGILFSSLLIQGPASAPPSSSSSGM